MFRHWLFILLLPFTLVAAKYELSICAIFQNDAAFLKEWIEFHKLVGVEHFYLYNNLSTDHFAEVLKPYIKKKEVTLIEWPYAYNPADGGVWHAIQCNSYLDCLQKYGPESSWIAFVDTDEYLFCPSGEKLTSFLRKYKQYGGVGANWLMFGTSNIYDIPPKGLMIEYLTHSSEINSGNNLHIKSIVQPKYVSNCRNMHFFDYVDGKYCVGSDFQKIDGPLTSSVHIDQIRINHYWARTEKYLHEYKIPRRNHMYGNTGDQLIEFCATFNIRKDEAILKYVPKLRKQMGFSKK